jgi:murein DD-endopeptidase MepM/ murein hydrolase activator NlpD
MRLSAVATLMILTTIFLSGCAQDNPATLTDNAHNFYGHNGVHTDSAMQTPNSYAAPMTVSQASAAPVAPRSFAAPAVVNTAKVEPKTPSAPLRMAAWQWPVDGRVTQRFGHQPNGIANEGITIAAADGTPIHAAQAGEVAYVGHNMRDYGNMVILRHPNGDMTSYAHASAITVKKGDRVQPGTVIGYVGESGRAKTPQLHFALREGDRAIDPLSRLPSQVASN